MQEPGEPPKGLLPMARYVLSLRCWALLHHPGLTDLEDDLALLMADADSSEVDAEMHMRILQHYSNVRLAVVLPCAWGVTYELHHPGLTKLALLMADADSSEVDAEMHMRILQHYSNVRLSVSCLVSVVLPMSLTTWV